VGYFNTFNSLAKDKAEELAEVVPPPLLGLEQREEMFDWISDHSAAVAGISRASIAGVSHDSEACKEEGSCMVCFSVAVTVQLGSCSIWRNWLNMVKTLVDGLSSSKVCNVLGGIAKFVPFLECC